MSAVSIVIPTIGRPTLKGTLRSIVPQIGADDEVIVIADPAGDVATAVRIFDRYAADSRWRIETLPSPGGDMGYKARTLGDSLATCPLIHHMDDDDSHTPNALDAIRGASLEYPTIYRMSYYHGGTTLWQTQTMFYGHFGTPCGVIPNRPGLLGDWIGYNGSNNGGDFVFISQCAERMGGVYWDERVVCWVKPG